MFRATVVLALFCVQSASAETHTWVSINGNFSDPASWSTGKAPSEWAAEDGILFDGVYQTPAVSGLDIADVRVALIVALSTYLGNIGTANSPLRIQADDLDFRGRGSLHLEAINDPGTFNTAHIDAPDSLEVSLAGHFDYLVVSRGQIEILPETIVAHSLIVVGDYVHLGQGPSIPRTIVVYGLVRNDRDLDGGHEIMAFGGNIHQYGILHDCSSVIVNSSFAYYAENTDNNRPFGEFFSTLYIGDPNAHFRFGYSLPDFYYYGSKGYASTDLASLGLLNYRLPGMNGFLERSETYSCPKQDADGDGRVTLQDFAAFQNSMTGP